MTLIPFMQSCLNDYDDDLYNIQGGMPFNAALATVVNPSEVPGEAVIESDNDGIAYVVNPEKLTRLETNNLDNASSIPILMQPIRPEMQTIKGLLFP